MTGNVNQTEQDGYTDGKAGEVQTVQVGGKRSQKLLQQQKRRPRAESVVLEIKDFGGLELEQRARVGVSFMRVLDLTLRNK